MFSWMDAYRKKQKKELLEVTSYEMWWDKLQKEVSQSKVTVNDKKRQDKLSGLLLFSEGVPDDRTSYVVENSTVFGNVQYPLITEKSFEEFISNMFAEGV